MSLDYEEELDYKATTATLPKRDWYHAKFMCRVFAAEALGLGLICFLVTVHGGTGSLKSDVSGPVTASAAFAVAVWIVGPVSGPQITPILSIALLLTRRINFVYCILGIAGQICGGVLGVALGSRLIPGMSERNDVFFQNPGPGVTDGQAFGMECVCSFLLIICCLSTMDEFRKPHWADGHITVFSLVVFLLILMLASPLAKVTGCGMNPSATLAGAIYNHRFQKIWIYIVAPISGSIIAVLLWEMLISDGASIERTKHWWTDPNFDRHKDYVRAKREAARRRFAEEAMLRIGLLETTKFTHVNLEDSTSKVPSHLPPEQNLIAE
ncbi:AQP-1 [Fasciolopsis buskii]|uniref:AQP-1 n=1 Tax=Fasciolopsis buskii TaxID=27845 RepID=A0A8E0RPF6_9TREM|nr:AQP-1 [Fasciolopsis buski]